MEQLLSQVIKPFENNFEEEINSFDINRNNLEIFAVGCQGTVYVCDSVEFTIKKKLKYEHSLKDFINPIAITENGEKLIIGFTTMYTLVVWNLKNDYKQFRQILLEDGYGKFMTNIISSY